MIEIICGCQMVLHIFYDPRARYVRCPSCSGRALVPPPAALWAADVVRDQKAKDRRFFASDRPRRPDRASRRRVAG
ncbi:MAG: hypothetical protein N2C14_31095 [Planctomycetales bacterium]